MIKVPSSYCWLIPSSEESQTSHHVQLGIYGRGEGFSVCKSRSMPSIVWKSRRAGINTGYKLREGGVTTAVRRIVIQRFRRKLTTWDRPLLHRCRHITLHCDFKSNTFKRVTDSKSKSHRLGQWDTNFLDFLSLYHFKNTQIHESLRTWFTQNSLVFMPKL